MGMTLINRFCFLFLWVAVFQLGAFSSAHAQIVGSESLWYKDFVLHNKPPKYLLSRKSAVFLRVPRSEVNPDVRSDWQELSAKIHKYLLNMKIDVVGYYHVDDIFSGSDPMAAHAQTLAKRDIKYILLVTQTRNETPGEPDHFEVIVTPFSEEVLIKQNANAWKVEGYGLKEVMNKMFKEVYRAELALENYLIIDRPEFFTDVKILKGKRIQTYAMDLKVDKLIVPKFQKIVPEDSIKLSSSAMDQVRAYNAEVDQKNKRLAEIMKGYPLPYEISSDLSETEIYNRGGQFILQSLHTTGETVKELLDYKTDAGETVYATIKATDIGATVRRLPKDAVVHKYYVKHVYSKDVYTGLKWDADLTWEEALKNFIFHMKDVLNVQ